MRRAPGCSPGHTPEARRTRYYRRRAEQRCGPCARYEHNRCTGWFAETRGRFDRDWSPERECLCECQEAELV